MSDGIKVRRGPLRQAPPRVVWLTDRQRELAWRGDCPTCEAPIVPMSEVAPAVPCTTPPDVGDAIRCESCHHYALVAQVEETPDHGRRITLHRVQVPEC